MLYYMLYDDRTENVMKQDLMRIYLTETDEEGGEEEKEEETEKQWTIQKLRRS